MSLSDRNKDSHFFLLKSFQEQNSSRRVLCVYTPLTLNVLLIRLRVHSGQLNDMTFKYDDMTFKYSSNKIEDSLVISMTFKCSSSKDSLRAEKAAWSFLYVFVCVSREPVTSVALRQNATQWIRSAIFGLLL